VHVIPRIRGSTAKPASTPSDAVYDGMANEEGNVGGALWDGVASGQRRPVGGGAFPRIEDASRGARSLEDMIAEVEEYQREMSAMGI
jgi:bis(5'-adenosyl)-triphosphatase